MALPHAVVGATHTAPVITWKEIGGTVHDLTAATLTGRIEDVSNVGRAIQGTLSVVSGPGGTFSWEYHANDVATAGVHEVQFTATFAGGKFDRTIPTKWIVERAL